MMPCFGPTDEEVRNSERRHGRFGVLSSGELGAIVCGLLRTGKVSLGDVDWAQAGVSEEYARQWWEEHQARDRRKAKGQG